MKCATKNDIGVQRILGRMPAPSKANFLPAGHAHNLWVKKDAIASARDSELAARAAEAKRRAFRDAAVNDALSKVDTKGETHYSILGLGHLGLDATVDEITDAYKKLLLVYHPDKAANATAKGEAKEMDETHDARFERLTEAFDTLTNLKSRRDYDSTYGEIDDSVPSKATAEDFFDVFGPVFKRNARWSEVQPTPAFGGPDTPWEEVSEFYDFWFEFRSWRQFPDGDEHNLKEADDREERRWMEQQNKRAREKKRKGEAARIMRLAETGYKYDPRVKKHLAAEKERKNAKKNAKRREQEEKERLEKEKKEREKIEKEAAEIAMKEAKAQAKREKEKLKKLLRKQRARLRELATADGSVSMDAVEDLCQFHQEEATLIAVCDRIDAGEITVQGALDEHKSFMAMSAEEQEKHKAEAAEKAAAAAEQKKAAAAASEAKGPWTPEELNLFLVAFQKFPGGTPQRWKTISEHVVTRTEDECIAMAKEVKKDASAVKSQVCKAHNKDFQEKEAPAARGSMDEDTADDTPSAPWSQEDQKKLENALKEFPASLPKSERFEKIAAKVGRSKRDCFQRFKEIVLELQQKAKK